MKPSKLLDKLQKNSKIKETTTLLETDVYEEGEFIPTSVPMLNVALSGDLNKGLTRGVHILAGQSKTWKTSAALVMASSFLDHFEDGAILFYDSEFGSPKKYFETCGIDPSRVVYTPVGSIEELKVDLNNQLAEIDKGDHIMIVIDSIGNLASRKELEDSLSGKAVADMTRAKSIRSLLRTITFQVNQKDIPLVAINHVYTSMDFIPKDIVGGGTSVMYNANNVYIISRRQNKEGKDLVGYDFTLKVEKSRYVREQSKIPITVTWEGGIAKYSGLLECAMELGFVTSPAKGWYECGIIDWEPVGQKFRKKDLGADFWDPILSNTDFQKAIQEKYQI